MAYDVKIHIFVFRCISNTSLNFFSSIAVGFIEEYQKRGNNACGIYDAQRSAMGTFVGVSSERRGDVRLDVLCAGSYFRLNHEEGLRTNSGRLV